MHHQLRQLIARAWNHHNTSRSTRVIAEPSAPVLYFGDREAYNASSLKVVTVGLNPSNAEFPEGNPFQRFPGADNGDPDRYVESLNAYFRTAPYTGWFNPAFESMLNGLGCSYYAGQPNVALHTDLCTPLATDPTWSKLKPDVRDQLQADGVQLWHDLVRFLRPDVIIISVAKKHLDLIQFPLTQPWRTIYTVQRENPYEVRATRVAIDDEHRALVVFGRAANLPFGTLSKRTKQTVGTYLKDTYFNDRDKLCFVQFLHPGGEHRPDHGDVKEWNRGPHKRKFMRVHGRCVHDGKPFEGDLLFWGEWEAQSKVIERIDDPLPNGPRYVYRPYYSPPKSYRGFQNTDPFVFNGFFYTGCQQHTVKGPTQLRYLKVGSVILFGSCVGERNFAIDTVFVVADWIEHDHRNVKHAAYPFVPEGYRDVTFGPWYQPQEKTCTPSKQSFRLYFGATQEKPLAGMFSFFPCLPASDGSSGFVRPIIRIPGVIKDTHKQSKKLNAQSDLWTVVEFWKDVVGQVEEQGCWLGVHATMPRRLQQSDQSR